MRLERRSGAVHYAAMTTAIGTPRAKRAGRAAVALIGLVLTAMVAGCATPPPAPRVFDLTFAHLPILSLDVARIEVVSDYVPSLKPPNVEHLFPMPPETGLRRWAADRLKAKGQKGSARFVIVNAAVTEAALPITKGSRVPSRSSSPSATRPSSRPVWKSSMRAVFARVLPAPG